MRVACVVGGCLALLLAAGCGAPAPETLSNEPPSTEAPAGEEPAAQAPASDSGGPAVRATIHPDLPQFSFRLVGEPLDGAAETFVATGLEIHRDGEAGPVQVGAVQGIDGLAAEIPLGGLAEPIEVLDMNFDGYGDIRIIEFLPAGPNVPYLNWLFDPASGRFVSSPELDEIPSPTFDAATRRIRSEWRDGATTYGTDVYEVVGGKPVLVGKELREYTEAGVYERTLSQKLDGEWRVVERQVVRE